MTKKIDTATSSPIKNRNLQQDVLYQKLGSTWFMFTTDDHGETYYVKLPSDFDPTKSTREIYVEVAAVSDATSEASKDKRLNLLKSFTL